MNLIAQFKEDHDQISEIFSEVIQYGISLEEAKNRLKKLRKLLTDHLKKEDECMYPILERASEFDEDLRKKLNETYTVINSIKDLADKFSVMKFQILNGKFNFFIFIGCFQNVSWKRNQLCIINTWN